MFRVKTYRIPVHTFALLPLLSVGIALPADAQRPQASSIVPVSREAKPLTQGMLYRHFLAYQLHLDAVATDLEKRGKDGSEFRDYFQRKLQFETADYTPVRDAASRLDKELSTLDAQAKKIIDAVHEKYPPGNLGSRPPILPLVPPELKELQNLREQAIQRELDTLKLQLGPQKFTKLDTMLHQEFAPSVTVRPVSLPHALDPKKYPVPPFQPEVQK